MPRIKGLLIGGRTNGVLISTDAGRSGDLCASGTSRSAARCSSTTGAKVYQGMIIGQHTPSDNDLDVNPLKCKQLTNIRTTSKDEAVRLTPLEADDPGAGDGLYRATMSWWK